MGGAEWCRSADLPLFRANTEPARLTLRRSQRSPDSLTEKQALASAVGVGGRNQELNNVYSGGQKHQEQHENRYSPYPLDLAVQNPRRPVIPQLPRWLFVILPLGLKFFVLSLLSLSLSLLLLLLLLLSQNGFDGLCSVLDRLSRGSARCSGVHGLMATLNGCRAACAWLSRP